MPATFNEFQRELNKRISDPQVAFMMAMIFERLGQILNDQETMAKMLVTFADQLAGFVEISEQHRKRLVQIGLHVGAAGVDVQSVANDPEDSKH